MKSKILVAHQSSPSDFQNEFDIEFFGTDYTNVIEEIVDLLNEHQLRDCIFKIEDAPQETMEGGAK